MPKSISIYLSRIGSELELAGLEFNIESMVTASKLGDARSMAILTTKTILIMLMYDAGLQIQDVSRVSSGVVVHCYNKQKESP